MLTLCQPLSLLLSGKRLTFPSLGKVRAAVEEERSSRSVAMGHQGAWTKWSERSPGMISGRWIHTASSFSFRQYTTSSQAHLTYTAGASQNNQYAFFLAGQAHSNTSCVAVQELSLKAAIFGGMIMFFGQQLIPSAALSISAVWYNQTITPYTLSKWDKDHQRSARKQPASSSVQRTGSWQLTWESSCSFPPTS